MKCTKEDIIRIRRDAKSQKEWANAVGVSLNTLVKYCKLYSIPTDLNVNYIPPLEKPVENTGSLSDSDNTAHQSHWDPSLIGKEEVKQSNKFVPIYVTGERNALNGSYSSLRTTPPTPGNPIYRQGNLGAGGKKHTI